MAHLTYTIILTPAEEGGFTVTVPALPAVITEGDTYDEAIEMAREAIALYLESLKERGKPIPQEEPDKLPKEARVELEWPAAI